MQSSDVVNSLQNYFSDKGKAIVCAYLFGSMARRVNQKTSDIDIGILLPKDPAGTLDDLALDLKGDLERRLRASIDLVVLNRASPDLVHRVLRDGILLYEGDARARVRFETRKRAAYFDVLPYLRQYRRAQAGPVI